MAGLGFDLSCCQPKLLTCELAEQADAVVTMGCGDQCPFIPAATTSTRTSLTRAVSPPTKFA